MLCSNVFDVLVKQTGSLLYLTYLVILSKFVHLITAYIIPSCLLVALVITFDVVAIFTSFLLIALNSTKSLS